MRASDVLVTRIVCDYSSRPDIKIRVFPQPASRARRVSDTRRLHALASRRGRARCAPQGDIVRPRIVAAVLDSGVPLDPGHPAGHLLAPPDRVRERENGMAQAVRRRALGRHFACADRGRYLGLRVAPERFRRVVQPRPLAAGGAPGSLAALLSDRIHVDADVAGDVHGPESTLPSLLADDVAAREGRPPDEPHPRSVSSDQTLAPL